MEGGGRRGDGATFVDQWGKITTTTKIEHPQSLKTLNIEKVGRWVVMMVYSLFLQHMGAHKVSPRPNKSKSLSAEKKKFDKKFR